MKKTIKFLMLITITVLCLSMTSCTSKLGIKTPYKGIKRNSCVIDSNLGPITITNDTDTYYIVQLIRSNVTPKNQKDYDCFEIAFKGKNINLGKISAKGLVYNKNTMLNDKDEPRLEYYSESYENFKVKYKGIKSKFIDYQTQSNSNPKNNLSYSKNKTLGLLMSGVRKDEEGYHPLYSLYSLRYLDYLPTLPLSPSYEKFNFIDEFHSNSYGAFNSFKRTYGMTSKTFNNELVDSIDKYEYSHKIYGKYLVIEVNQPYGIDILMQSKDLEAFKKASESSGANYNQVIYFNLKTNQVDYVYAKAEDLIDMRGTGNTNYTMVVDRVNKENKVRREIKKLDRYTKIHSLFGLFE